MRSATANRGFLFRVFGTLALILLAQLAYFQTSVNFVDVSSMPNVHWWYALGQTMHANGFFKTWTPYPPVFPLLFYTLLFHSAQASFQAVEANWQAMNMLLVVASSYLIYCITAIVRRDERSAWLAAGFFLAVILASFRSTFGLSYLNDQFEYLPMTITFLGLLWIVERRWFWVGLVAATGFLTKIYPGVLVLVALAVLPDWRSFRNLAAGAILATFLILVPYALHPGGVTSLKSMVSFTLSRDGWESAYTYPAFKFAPIPPASFFVTPFTADPTAVIQLRYRLLLPLFVLLALGCTGIARWRRVAIALAPQLTLGFTALFLVLSKGFSSYFVLWVLPLLFTAYAFDVASVIAMALLIASNEVFVHDAYFLGVFTRQLLVGLIAVAQGIRAYVHPRLKQAHDA